MAERRASDLDGWVKKILEAALTELDPFLRGLDQDHDAAVAGLRVLHSYGPSEGVNTGTKLIKRQMYGRTSFELLRHRNYWDSLATNEIEQKSSFRHSLGTAGRGVAPRSGSVRDGREAVDRAREKDETANNAGVTN
ncbi:transposase [Nocardia elegans]|uniref:transposase n=1 Tax=Nocardia elegans TaxID=300029 RepID=UPI00226BCCDD|nr:transposase [Nocardia elegans]